MLKSFSFRKKVGGHGPLVPVDAGSVDTNILIGLVCSLNIFSLLRSNTETFIDLRKKVSDTESCLTAIKLVLSSQSTNESLVLANTYYIWYWLILTTFVGFFTGSIGPAFSSMGKSREKKN